MLNNYINVLTSKELVKIDDYKSKSIVSLVLFIASSILIIVNYLKDSHAMMICSIILSVGFFISFIVASLFKNAKISSIIISLLAGFILSYFAISGGNNGFAILWILLVPVFAINLIGIEAGLFVSTYFLIFIFTLFYSTLKENIIDKYTVEFISRFPILYLADYVISTYLALQKEYYYRLANRKSYIDELTNTYNRRYFMEKIMDKIEEDEDYGLIVIDVNGLKVINDKKGHKAGDDLIKALPICFKIIFGNETQLCRIGGDEYAAITTEDSKVVKTKIKDLKKLASTFDYGEIEGFTFAIGYADTKKYKKSKSNVNDIYMIADELMYKDKAAYYKSAKIDRRKRTH